MHALMVLPAAAEDDELPPALFDEAVVDAPVGALPLLLAPPFDLLPQPDMTSAMAATPAITALVRRPRTIFVPSDADPVDPRRRWRTATPYPAPPAPQEPGPRNFACLHPIVARDLD